MAHLRCDVVVDDWLALQAVEVSYPPEVTIVTLSSLNVYICCTKKSLSLSGLYQSWLFNETKKFSGKYCTVINPCHVDYIYMHLQ